MNRLNDKIVSRNQLLRLPQYLNYLIAKEHDGIDSISSTQISNDLKLSEEKVRKDIALVSKKSGVPGRGRDIKELIEDIKDFLGYKDVNSAVLVGCGSLGKALLGYPGFDYYGLKIIAGFDSDPNLWNKEIGNKKIFSIDKLNNLCQRMNIHIGIICVPAKYAQKICDTLVSSGVLAIWNFAPVHLQVPDGIIVQNENMGASLAILSNKLQKKIKNMEE